LFRFQLKQIISRCKWWTDVEEMDVVDMHAQRNGFLEATVRMKLRRIVATQTMKKDILSIIPLSLRLGPFDVDPASIEIKGNR
jgi:hypothetical protein